MVDSAQRHLLAGHLLQTQRLGSELDVVIDPFLARAMLVFHRVGRAVRKKLDHVALAYQPQSIRPDLQRSLHPPVTRYCMAHFVSSCMLRRATQRMNVVGVLSFHVNQAAAARAVGPVIQRRERNQLCIVQHRAVNIHGIRHS
jgi:hypothetical protein